jgi:hypothetical protein
MADQDEHEHEGEVEGRVTSPMQEFSSGQVGMGLLVMVVGLVVTFGLAFGLVGI